MGYGAVGHAGLLHGHHRIIGGKWQSQGSMSGQAIHLCASTLFRSVLSLCVGKTPWKMTQVEHGPIITHLCAGRREVAVAGDSLCITRAEAASVVVVARAAAAAGFYPEKVNAAAILF